MSHKMLRPFIVKVSVLGYFPLHIADKCSYNFDICYCTIFEVHYQILLYK